MTEERKLAITIPEELYAELGRIADAIGLRDAEQAASIGLAQWAAWRKAELDHRDPDQKYFVNEALDQLLAGKK
jgi:hypothetical protein